MSTPRDFFVNAGVNIFYQETFLRPWIGFLKLLGEGSSK